MYEEDEQRRINHERQLAMIGAKRSMVDLFWSLLVQTFGKNTVDLAIMEAERRIGTLPYVE